jgi:hypothetical protein
MAKEQERLFSDDIKINKYKLEEECEKQASIYFYWAEKLALAKTLLDEAIDKSKLIAAQTEMAIRKNWDDEYLAKYGKSTENSIKSVLEIKMEESRQNIRDAQSEVNILQASVNALEHRKYELDNLTTLLVKGFYAAPNGGRREGVIESTERDVRKKLKKKE